MDCRPQISGKLIFSLMCAMCAAAIAVAAPHFSVDSPAFKPGAAIPERYTCDAGGAMPSLRIGGAPVGTAALAVVVDDPDAPGGLFTHYLAWNLPATSDSLDGTTLPPGAVIGQNDFGAAGWGGPCPPAGKPHHYRFRVLALKAPLALGAGADRAAFDRALAGNVLAEASLVGTYRRR